jgi:hypothetical protein
MKKSFKTCFAISINLLILVACEKDEIVQNNAIVIYSDINSKHISNLDSTKIESGLREIKISDDWQSDYFNIFRPSITSLPYMFENIGNTYKVQNNKTIYDCYNLPFNTPLYLGFKYSDDDNNCLGWLRLVVINSVNLILFEYGYFQI